MAINVKPEIKGNVNALFNMHGDVSIAREKIVTAISFMSGNNNLDIDELNRTSEQGGIYVRSNGTILNDFDDNTEMYAKYKIVPTGLKLKRTNTPLFASFMKVKSGWEGAYIGTAITLFQMYRDHFNESETSKFSTDYLQIFSMNSDIKGFGLSGISKDPNYTEDDEAENIYISSTDQLKYMDNDRTINSLEAAINKLQLSNNLKEEKSKPAQHKTKEQRKKERLQSHLDKVKSKVGSNESEPSESLMRAIESAKNLKSTHTDTNTQDICDETAKLNQNNTVVSEVLPDNTQISKNKENLEKSLELEKVLEELSVEDYEELEGTKVSKQMKVDIKYNLTHSIYERLLIKEDWESNPNKNRLAFYLKGICAIVFMNQFKEQALRGNGYLYSNDRQTSLINTNLLDMYGNCIYLIDHTPGNPDFYDKDIEMFNSKADLLKLNFDNEEIKRLPEPLQIIKDKKDLLFDGKIEDFDFNDIQHLDHIITERKHRFPEKYRNESALYLCEKIKYAVERAIKINIIDYKYIVPKYDFTRDKVQYLIPLYFDSNIEEKPDIVIVADEEIDNHWQIYTVLHSEDAYDSARLIGRPNVSWIRDTNKK
jgi:hypothetical protein